MRFKGAVDDIFRELSDELVRTLQSTTESEAEKVLQFVLNAQDKLSANPKSIDEIEAMNKDAMEIGRQKSEIQTIFDGLQKKNLMIKQSQGTGMKLGDLESKWNEFNSRLAFFNDKIEDQKQ